MSHKTAQHIMHISDEFLEAVGRRIPRWNLGLGQEHKRTLVTAVLSAHFENSPLIQRDPSIRVLWAGCYFRDFDKMDEAFKFACELAHKQFNLPVLLTESVTKAGWHGSITLPGKDETDETVGDMRDMPGNRGPV